MLGALADHNEPSERRARSGPEPVVHRREDLLEVQRETSARDLVSQVAKHGREERSVSAWPRSWASGIATVSVCVRLVRKLRAARLTTYPWRSAIARIVSRTLRSTSALPASARDTVETCTPARRAISAIVVAELLVRAMAGSRKSIGCVFYDAVSVRRAGRPATPATRALRRTPESDREHRGARTDRAHSRAPAGAGRGPGYRRH